MQGLHRSKGTQSRKDESRLTGQVADLSRQLVALKPVAQLEKAAQAVADDYQAIVQISARLWALWQHQDELAKNLAEIGRLDAEVAALSHITPPPHLTGTVPLAQLIQTMGSCNRLVAFEADRSISFERLREPPQLTNVSSLFLLCENIEVLERQQNALAGQQRCLVDLTPPSDMQDTGHIESLIEQLAAIEMEVSRLQGPPRILAALPKPPELPDEAPLAELIGDIETAAQWWSGLDAAHTCLAPLSGQPELVDIAGLMELIDGFEEAEGIVRDSERELATAETRLAHAEQALRQWAETNRVCPTCGSELDPEQIISLVASGVGGHRHG